MLVESDSPGISTGFGHVIRYLTHYFSHLGLEQIVVGWQNTEIPRMYCAKCEQDLVMHGKYIDKCPRYYYVPGGPFQSGYNGRVSFPGYIRKYKPNVVFSLCDINWMSYVPDLKKDAKWMAYFPIDGDHWNDLWKPIFDKCEYPVTYSKFGQKVCEKNGYKVDMIYHGCDPMVFKKYPDDDIKLSKYKNFTKAGMPADPFVVGTIQTINPRKNWYSWLATFAEFAKDKPDVIACIIADPDSPMSLHARIDILRVIASLGIRNKVWLPGDYHYWGGWSDKHLAEVLNWFRRGCYYTVAGGEGFGLGQFQAMYCGTPVVALDYTTPTEFFADGRGYLIKKGESFRVDQFERPLPDFEDAVKQLNRVYYNPEEVKKVTTKAAAWAYKHTWANSMHKWARKFKQIEDEWDE